MTHWQRYGVVYVAYALALMGAVLLLVLLPAEGFAASLLVRAALADAVATLIVFAFSLAYRNSSFYDPYWSVVPPALLGYWWWAAGSGSDPRLVLLALCVGLWAVRLTHNWGRGWQGLGDEDWRYRQLQAQLKVFYWPVSLLGIHLLPTIWVFLGCLGLYLASGAALLDQDRGLMLGLDSPAVRGLNGWDAVALAVSIGAIWLERRADLELLSHRQTRQSRAEVLRTGVWAWCRHPNYLGEIGFWVGVALFGAAAHPDALWVWLGPAVMILLFAGLTVGMIERKLAADKPEYAAYQAAVPRLLPLPVRRG